MHISRMDICLTLLTFAYLCCTVCGEEDTKRDPKLSIFQVVKFSNSHCTGGSRNGTCFTQAECDNIGGSKDGTCADGFGVCCIITLSTGQSSAANNSYIVLTSTDTLSSGGYQYTICPCSDDICRIMFDFNTFEINGPVTGDTGTTTSANTVLASDKGALGTAVAIGDCMIDSFSITSPSGRSSPIICGTNPNQHMIIDMNGNECTTVNLGIGGTSTTTRELDIQVKQYRCGDEQGGPSGCLQYFDSTTDRIRSFNFPDVSNGATIAYNYVHLSRQHYKACVRRGLAKQYICWIPCTDTVGADENTDSSAVDGQPSFGLSIGPNAVSKSAINSQCGADYVTIGGFISSANAVILASIVNPIATLGTRICGRYFATVGSAAYNTQSVCALSVPFEIGVDFNDDEFCSANTNALTCESQVTKNSVGGGGGILGFSLCYAQT